MRDRVAGEHPGLAGVPPPPAPERAVRAPGVRRSRRQGPGAGRGLARGGAGPLDLLHDSRCRRASAAGSSSTASCSTARPATPATSATSSSSPTAAAAAAVRVAASRPRRRAPRSRRSPAGRRRSRRTRSCVAPAASSVAASASICTMLDLDLVVVGGGVALGFAATFFNAAQEELDRHALIGHGVRPADHTRPPGRSRSADRCRRGGDQGPPPALVTCFRTGSTWETTTMTKIRRVARAASRTGVAAVAVAAGSVVWEA